MDLLEAILNRISGDAENIGPFTPTSQYLS